MARAKGAATAAAAVGCGEGTYSLLSLLREVSSHNLRTGRHAHTKACQSKRLPPRRRRRQRRRPHMARPPWWTSSTRSTGRRARCTAPSNPDPNPIPSSNPNRNPSPDPSPDPNPDPHKVLNATGSLQNVLKQGLRDQEGMLLESDADEQVTNCLTDPDPDPDPNPSPSPSPSLDPDPNPSRPEPYCSSNQLQLARAGSFSSL